MIDLAATREQLLAELGAPATAAGTPLDPTDPRFVSGERVRARVEGPSRDAIFPLLEAVLSARFADVPREQRHRDLLAPLKNALGNAYKHGNGRNRGKSIAVEIAATGRGALVSVSDAGAGFDVTEALRRLRSGEASRDGRGAGLRALERARSRVAWENGGRTVLLRFLPSCEAAPRRAAYASAAARTARELERALAAEREAWGSAWSELETCRVYVEPNGDAEGARLRCVLRGRGPGVRGLETRILSGRLLASEADACADLEASRALHAQLPGREVRVPRPSVRLRAEPRLVLYEFAPWMDLGEYLTQRAEPGGLARAAARVGSLLRALHASGIPLPEEAPQATLERVRAVDPRLARLAPHPLAPVHGSFGFHRVHYGVDGRFYVEGFERARRSHPGWDVGGFLADLARDAAALSGAEPAGAAREAFFSTYLGEDAAPEWLADLPAFEEAARR